MTLISDQVRSYSSSSGYYSLLLPRNWEFEEDDVCVSFYRSDNGIGALQLSAYGTGDRQCAKHVLMEYLEEEEVTDSSSILHIQNEEKEQALTTYIRLKTFYKVWVITKDEILILATYNRSIEESSEEEQEVDKIIASLRVLE